MKLEELDVIEAYSLAQEWLKRLSEAGVTIMSARQQNAYNGILYYAELQRLRLNAQSGSPSDMLLLSKKSFEYLPFLYEVTPVINRWLEAGQPLEGIETIVK
jgi:hypothetical protein